MIQVRVRSRVHEVHQIDHTIDHKVVIAKSRRVQRSQARADSLRLLVGRHIGHGVKFFRILVRVWFMNVSQITDHARLVKVGAIDLRVDTEHNTLIVSLPSLLHKVSVSEVDVSPRTQS